MKNFAETKNLETGLSEKGAILFGEGEKEIARAVLGSLEGLSAIGALSILWKCELAVLQCSAPTMEHTKRQTKHCVCQSCGKEWHTQTAKFCGNCGNKLKEAPCAGRKDIL